MDNCFFVIDRVVRINGFFALSSILMLCFLAVHLMSRLRLDRLLGGSNSFGNGGKDKLLISGNGMRGIPVVFVLRDKFDR